MDGLQESIRLFRGVASGRRLIRLLAVLGLVGFFAQIYAHRTVSVFGVILTIFYVISIWLLRGPQNAKPATS